MGFNWLDVLLVLILGTALVLGIIKGLVRQIVGILAVIVGLILAIAFYAPLASAFSILSDNEVMTQFLCFAFIFLVVLVAGWLIGRMFSKAMKGPLKFMNHVFGGAFGLLKGALICGILVFALLVFPVNSEALKSSSIAPYCIKVTRGIINLIPQELKQAFFQAYEDIFGKGEKDVTRI